MANNDEANEVERQHPDVRATVHPEPRRDTRVQVAAAVVWRDGRLLLTQRPPGGALGLQWELPGGKVERGETPEHAVVREIREELGVRASAHEVLAVETHDYAHGLQVELVFVHCTLHAHDFTRSAAVHAVRWSDPRELDLSEVLAGDRAFLRALGASEGGARRAGAA